MLHVDGIRLVQLMVAGAEDVNLLLGKDVVLIEALWGGAVVDAAAFDAVAGVDEEEVGAFVVSQLAHVLREGDVVAPVGGKGGSEDVAVSRDDDGYYKTPNMDISERGVNNLRWPYSKKCPLTQE